MPRLCFVLTIALLSGCAGSGSSERAALGPPSRDELAGAVYLGIMDEPVRLTDGRWEGEPYVGGAATRPSLQLVDGLIETGDIGGDGREESVAILVAKPGGSGIFVYVAVVGREGGEPVNVGTALVGDRVSVRTVYVDQGLVELDVVQQGPGDPACCPTQKALRGWRLTSEGLIEVSSEVTGVASVADLEGPDWIVTRFGWNEPAPADPRLTLRVEGNSFAGSSGCNEYFAEVREDAPGEITVGPVASTKKLCAPGVMALEERYLSALRGAVSYRFDGGRLALTYADTAGTEMMIFVPSEKLTQPPD